MTSSRRRVTRSIPMLLASLILLSPAHAAAQVPSPDQHFGFRMGADGRLAAMDEIEKYFDLVAGKSDRVKVVELGPTTERHRTIAAIVSAAENIRTLDRIRDVNQRLADPRTLEPDEARQLAAAQKAVLAIGGSIHGTEVGATQTMNELLYVLATADDSDTLDILRNVVVILIPSLNPDGQRLVVDWYNAHKGTPFEGGPMPRLDHQYAGHDLNRDGFMMNMAESRNLSRFFYTQWHPHVFLSMHQMPGDGPRFFAPPNTDPIDANTDPLIWREAALLGSAMTLELERDHHAGVMSSGPYDYYWPGYEDSVPLGHNTVCLLTEAANVAVATPVDAPGTSAKNDGSGPDLRRQISAPNPWPGGRWTLRDIVDYELSAVRGLLRAVSVYREPIVRNFYEMGAHAVEDGRRAAPAAYLISPDQRDPFAARKLEDLLLQAGVEIYRAIEPFSADGAGFPAGTDVILLAQPYRAYVKTLLERQDYPVRKSAGATERPYDATGWMLPAQMGVDVRGVARLEPPAMSRITSAAIEPGKIWGERSPSYYLLDARGASGAIAINRLLTAGLAPASLTKEFEAGGYRYPAGSVVSPPAKAAAPTLQKITKELGLRSDGVKGKTPVNLRKLIRARVALYKPWLENTDEGWTRWLLEQYEFPYATVTPADIRAGNLRSRFDAIILPSATRDQLIDGLSAREVPPDYVGGLGSDETSAIKAFVQAGGTLICLDHAGAFAISAFDLPIRDVAQSAGDHFFCPGSLLRIDLNTSDPLSYGLDAQVAGFFSFSSAYEMGTAPAGIQTIARYAQKELLVSGWLEGDEVIAGRPAVVQATVGMGRVILLGFPVQHRAESMATFRLLFNSIFTSR